MTRNMTTNKDVDLGFLQLYVYIYFFVYGRTRLSGFGVVYVVRNKAARFRLCFGVLFKWN